MPNDLDIIQAAIIETDREIAAEAWDQESVPLDTDGDRSPEAMGDGLEGQVEVDDEDESEESEEDSEEESEEESAEEQGKEESKPQAKPEAKPEPKDTGRVPPGRLREASERARAAEAERDRLKSKAETERANARKEMDELKGKFDGVMQLLQRLQPQQPAKEQPRAEAKPDLFENPDGFIDQLNKGVDTKVQTVEKRLDEMRIATSMQIAHAIHKEAFEKAWDAVQKLDQRDPENAALCRRIGQDTNPGEALVKWHKRSETLRVVGDDPDKYRQTVADEVRQSLMRDPEFRKQLLDELHAEASNGNNGQPRTITRLPKSLNGAAGGSRPGIALENFDGSEQAIADSAWR